MAETVYVTRDVLGWRSARKCEVKKRFKNGMIDVVPFGRAYEGQWFTTWSDALAACERQRAERIAYYKREIAKLENLTFVEPTEITR